MNLLKYSNGCVMFVDFSFFAMSDYNKLLAEFSPLAQLIGRKLEQIGNFSRVFMHGFSFGARLATAVGIVTTNGTIGRMDLLDPAGIFFLTREQLCSSNIFFTLILRSWF